MPTSNSRRISIWRVLATGLGLVLAPSVNAGTSTKKPCIFQELRREESPQPPHHYSSDNLPWSALVDEENGHVDVRETATEKSCRIELEDVRRVYGDRKTLVLRVIEISADYLFFFDPVTCRRILKPINLGFNRSEDIERQKLRKAGLCIGKPTE